MSEHAHELQEPCPRCEQCGAPVAVASTGRPRKFCSSRCRKRAQRSREAVKWSDYFDKLRERLIGDAANEFRDYPSDDSDPSVTKAIPPDEST